MRYINVWVRPYNYLNSEPVLMKTFSLPCDLLRQYFCILVTVILTSLNSTIIIDDYLLTYNVTRLLSSWHHAHRVAIMHEPTESAETNLFKRELHVIFITVSSHFRRGSKWTSEGKTDHSEAEAQTKSREKYSSEDWDRNALKGFPRRRQTSRWNEFVKKQ